MLLVVTETRLLMITASILLPKYYWNCLFAVQLGGKKNLFHPLLILSSSDTTKMHHQSFAYFEKQA